MFQKQVKLIHFQAARCCGCRLQEEIREKIKCVQRGQHRLHRHRSSETLIKVNKEEACTRPKTCHYPSRWIHQRQLEKNQTHSHIPLQHKPLFPWKCLCFYDPSSSSQLLLANFWKHFKIKKTKARAAAERRLPNSHLWLNSTETDVKLDVTVAESHPQLLLWELVWL